MRYRSTRQGSAPATFSEAVTRGLAPDGGLYLPERFPSLEPEAFGDANALPDVGAILLAPFLREDPLAGRLLAICARALALPLPLRWLPPDGPAVLELFHGPTAAFKDFGARFLAGCLAELPADPKRPWRILVATSGDTGSAVAAAFHDQPPGARVLVLYPSGRISRRQEHQLGCWGERVRALEVNGDFDTCQALVKAAFASPGLTGQFRLSSANSINLGRLLPQMSYYAAASLQVWRKCGQAPGFIVPTGNVGNALSGLWARRCGLPVGPVVLATNANRTVSDFLASGRWEPRPSIATLASAMDVGNPSNFERLRQLYPDDSQLRQQLRCHVVSDAEIREQIRDEFRRHGEIWCPHTATAMRVYRECLSAEERVRRPWIVLATAHAAKFEQVVEPLIGAKIPLPRALAELLRRPSHATPIEATLDAVTAQMS